MLYTKLALKNVRASFHDYLLYFLTLVLTVTLFYCFNAQDAIWQLTDPSLLSANVIELLQILNERMHILSFFVACILMILVFYANRTFILRRNKEFALYYVLGMRQKHWICVLYLETFFVAAMALAAGLVAGLLFSQLITTFTASLFISHVTYHFVFSYSSLLLTLFVFIVIFFLTTLINIIILLYRPIRSFHPQFEKTIPFSQKKVCCLSPLLAVCTFLISILLLLYDLSFISFIISFLLITCSNLFFLLSLYHFFPLLIKKSTHYCYQGLHMLTIQRLHRLISSNIKSLCILIGMLTIGITSLFTGLCISNNLNSEIDHLTPYSFSLIQPYEKENGKQGHVMAFDEEIKSLHIPSDWIQSENILHTYQSEFTYQTLYSLIDDYNLHVSWELALLKEPIEIIPLSSYNQLRRDQGLKNIKLKSGEILLYSCNKRFASAIHSLQQRQPYITLFNQTFHVLPKNVKSLRLSNAFETAPHDAAYLVVQDAMIPKNAKKYMEYWNIELKPGQSSHLFSSMIEEQIAQLPSSALNEHFIINRDEVHDNNLGFSVIFTYLSLFLGMILVISPLIILALKLLAPRYNELENAKLLEKLGTPLRLRRRDLFWQTLIFFSFPFALACIDSLIFLKAIKSFLYDLNRSGYAAAFLQTSCIILILYISYFAVTYFSRRSIAEADTI